MYIVPLRVAQSRRIVFRSISAGSWKGWTVQHWYGFNWVLCLLDFRKQDVGKFLLCGYWDHGHPGILINSSTPKSD